jgi:hypothetical protein
MRFLKPILAGAALLTISVPALASAQSYYGRDYGRDYGHRDYGYSRDYDRYGDRDYGWRWRHHHRYDYYRHHHHIYDNDYRYGAYWR